jgi:hypothetical protein
MSRESSAATPVLTFSLRAGARPILLPGVDACVRVCVRLCICIHIHLSSTPPTPHRLRIMLPSRRRLASLLVLLAALLFLLATSPASIQQRAHRLVLSLRLLGWPPRLRASSGFRRAPPGASVLPVPIRIPRSLCVRPTLARRRYVEREDKLFLEPRGQPALLVQALRPGPVRKPQPHRTRACLPRGARIRCRLRICADSRRIGCRQTMTETWTYPTLCSGALTSPVL